MKLHYKSSRDMQQQGVSIPAYLDTEAVALFLARRWSFFSARDRGLLESCLESLLSSTCKTWPSDKLAGAAVIAEELLQDSTSGALALWKAARPPKLRLEASIVPITLYRHKSVSMLGPLPTSTRRILTKLLKRLREREQADCASPRENFLLQLNDTLKQARTVNRIESVSTLMCEGARSTDRALKPRDEPPTN